MKECTVTHTDKLDKEKEIVEEYLMCPRCFQTVAITPELREVLDAMKNGTVSTTIPNNAIERRISSNTPAGNATAIA